MTLASSKEKLFYQLILISILFCLLFEYFYDFQKFNLNIELSLSIENHSYNNTKSSKFSLRFFVFFLNHKILTKMTQRYCLFIKLVAVINAICRLTFDSIHTIPVFNVITIQTNQSLRHAFLYVVCSTACKVLNIISYNSMKSCVLCEPNTKLKSFGHI